ncbi:hypothetical protein, partial [Enterococcus faecium]
QSTREIGELSANKPVHEKVIADLIAGIADMESRVSALSDELENLRKEKDAVYEKITAVQISRTKIEQDLERITETRKERNLA